MKMLLEEEEEQYEEYSRTKSVKIALGSQKDKDKNNKCNNSSISTDDESQSLVIKDFGIINRDEKMNQVFNILYKKINQKLSHVILFDILIDIDSKGTLQDQQEEEFRGFDLLHSLKPVYKVERKPGFVSFSFPEREIPLTDMNYSISLLEQQETGNYKDFANTLRLMQQRQEMYKVKMTEILERNNYDYVHLMEMKQKRQEYFHNYIQKHHLSNRGSKDQFINIAGYSISLLNKSTHLSYLAKSKELIYLLGTDEEQLARIALKKSQLDIFSFESRLQTQMIHINYILNGITKHKQDNFHIITYDHISIFCPAEFDTHVIKYPAELQYDPESPCDDFIVVSKFEIQPFHVKKVLGIRKQFDELQRYIQNFDQDFEYNIQSENFLSKFYTKVLKKIHKRDKVTEQKEREIKSRTCGYRPLNQQKV